MRACTPPTCHPTRMEGLPDLRLLMGEAAFLSRVVLSFQDKGLFLVLPPPEMRFLPLVLLLLGPPGFEVSILPCVCLH